MSIDWAVTKKLLTVFIIFIKCSYSSAQQLQIFQDVRQPAAQPLFEDDDMARGILFDQKPIRNNLLSGEESIPDSLVDPNGKLVADARIMIKNRTKLRLEDEKLLVVEIVNELKAPVEVLTWLFTLVGCCCIVACGVLPAFLFKLDENIFAHSLAGRQKLNFLLSFATGSLLGDVFLHLLPEVWSGDQDILSIGLWTLAGILSCFFIEKCCTSTAESQKRVCAMMNLCANIADNFTHGLAIGGSFVVCPKLGFLTTFAIVIHELPHEISDFAILLRGDFTILLAIKAQLLTAVGGILGACVALYTHATFASGVTTTRILAFTSGSFINIGLCQIVPDLLAETDSRQSLIQLLLVFGGTFCMHVLNYLR